MTDAELLLIEKQRYNDSIRNQIVALEVNQGRAVREAQLSGNNTYLQSIEDQIAQLRAQLRN